MKTSSVERRAENHQVSRSLSRWLWSAASQQKGVGQSRGWRDPVAAGGGTGASCRRRGRGQKGDAWALISPVGTLGFSSTQAVKCRSTADIGVPHDGGNANQGGK